MSIPEISFKEAVCCGFKMYPQILCYSSLQIVEFNSPSFGSELAILSDVLLKNRMWWKWWCRTRSQMVGWFLPCFLSWIICSREGQLPWYEDTHTAFVWLVTISHFQMEAKAIGAKSELAFCPVLLLGNQRGYRILHESLTQGFIPEKMNWPWKGEVVKTVLLPSRRLLQFHVCPCLSTLSIVTFFLVFFFFF